MYISTGEMYLSNGKMYTVFYRIHAPPQIDEPPPNFGSRT